MREKLKVFISKLKQHFQKKHFLMMAAAVLFIAASVSVPVHQAHALFPSGADLFSSAINSIVATGSWLLSPFKVLFYIIAIVVLNVLLNISVIFVKMGAWFIDTALDPRLYVGDPATGTPGVLTSSTINTGWTTVRDMCNTFYIFFLLIISFGTILRSSTFNAKNLLPKLVISLFLINFSAEITKLVIDFGQVFMYGIMGWMGTFKEGGGSLTSIVDQFNNLINFDTNISLSKVMLIATALAYSVILAIVYIMLALFLMVRLVAFVFLIILSPIAFLSITMPSLGKYTSEWWGELTKYSLFGPIFMFFVYLSATMANEMVIDYKPDTSTATGFDEIKDTIVMIFPHVIPLMMLLYVIPVTQRLGVAGAGKIIGGRLGLGNIVMGGYSGAKKSLGLGKWATAPVAKRTGMTDAYNRRKDSVLGGLAKHPVMKKLGLSTGILKIQSSDLEGQRGQVEKYKKDWVNRASPASLYGELKNHRGKSEAEVAAIIERMSEKKMINDKDMKHYGIDKDLSAILQRAKPALDADKLKESMPHWAAMAELGPGKTQKEYDEKTTENVTKLVEDNKLNSLNDNAIERPEVVKTISDQHDDFDRWLSSQSTSRQGAANIGLEKLLHSWQDEIHGAGRGTINTVSGPGLVGSTGMDGDQLRKEIDKLQSTMAKNDKDGHVLLKDPEIDASGKIVLKTDGRIDFNSGGSARNFRREEKFASEKMKSGNYKGKSEEFFTKVGGHFGYNNFEQLRREEGEEKMKAAVVGLKDEMDRLAALRGARTAAQTEKLRKASETYTKLRGNEYYKNLIP